MCFVLLFVCIFFFFKQKTAYEMRISDWSSDVCSSDLPIGRETRHRPADLAGGCRRGAVAGDGDGVGPSRYALARAHGVVGSRNLGAGSDNAMNGGDRKSTRLNSSH